MQFKHQQEFDVPAEYLFGRITNFNKFENHTQTSGFSFNRQGRLPIRIGTRWDISVPVRGRKRRFVAELSEYISPRTVSYKSVSNKYEGVLSISVEPVTATSSFMKMQLVAKSRSFATSMVFNSIRLARKRVNKRLRNEMEKLSVRIAKEYRSEV